MLINRLFDWWLTGLARDLEMAWTRCRERYFKPRKEFNRGSVQTVSAEWKEDVSISERPQGVTETRLGCDERLTVCSGTRRMWSASLIHYLSPILFVSADLSLPSLVPCAESSRINGFTSRKMILHITVRVSPIQQTQAYSWHCGQVLTPRTVSAWPFLLGLRSIWRMQLFLEV